MGNSFDFKPVETRRASEAIYDQVSAQILSGKLKPGDKLPSERELMDMFKRSRPTVREALRILENNGLIQTVSGSGAIVMRPTIESVSVPLEKLIFMGEVSPEDVIGFKRINDFFGIMWAPRNRTEEDIQALREGLESCRSSKDDLEAFVKADLLFHDAIIRAGKNRISIIANEVIHDALLKISLEALAQKSDAEKTEFIEMATEEHQLLFDAIRTGDRDSARRVMRRHVVAFVDMMDEEFPQPPRIFDAEFQSSSPQ